MVAETNPPRLVPCNETLPSWIYGKAATASRVVGQVNSHSLHEDEVRFLLPRELREKSLEELRPDERRVAVQVAIDRRLVLGELAKRGQMATEQEIELELDSLRERLSRRESSLEDYLSEMAISLSSLKHVVRWQLSWKRYLDRAITDENLRRYFEKHQRDFDGTQLKVAHSLWKVNAGESAETLTRKAASVKASILAGERTFREAAREFSQAPTAKAGGDIGWISRHEPMSEAFNDSAFQLAEDETSDPVITDAGIHLIHCLGVKPGAKTWRDSRAEIESAARNYLFRWLADRARPKAKIELRIQ